MFMKASIMKVLRVSMSFFSPQEEEMRLTVETFQSHQFYNLLQIKL